MADVLDLVSRFIDLFEGEPTVEAIFEIAGPGERFDYGDDQQLLRTDDAVFSVSIDEDPEFGITSVSIGQMRDAPSIEAIFERFGPGKQGVYSGPGHYSYGWHAIRYMDEDHWVTLVVGMYVDLDKDHVGSIAVQR